MTLRVKWRCSTLPLVSVVRAAPVANGETASSDPSAVRVPRDSAGWHRPDGARKVHYFRDGRSLCCDWRASWFAPELMPSLSDSCVACRARAFRRAGVPLPPLVGPSATAVPRKAQEWYDAVAQERRVKYGA